MIKTAKHHPQATCQDGEEELCFVLLRSMSVGPCGTQTHSCAGRWIPLYPDYDYFITNELPFTFKAIQMGNELQPRVLERDKKSCHLYWSMVLFSRESEKASLKFNIQRTKIMASSPITSWQIDRETLEAVTDFIFLGSKITASAPAGDYSHVVIKRCNN